MQICARNAVALLLSWKRAAKNATPADIVCVDISRTSSALDKVVSFVYNLSIAKISSFAYNRTVVSDHFKKKTFIFFPIEAGLAHIIRSLAVAEELVRRKHRVIFALTKKKHFLIKNKKIEVIDIGEYCSDVQSVRKIKDPAYVYPFVLEEIEILKRYKPDLAIIDFRLSAILSCKAADIPSVFLVNSDGLPYSTYLPDFKLPKVFHYLIKPLSQMIIFNFKVQYFNSLTKVAKLIGKNFTRDELLDMTYVVPEQRGYLPEQEHKYDVYYVGPIWWEGFETVKPAWLDRIKPDGRTIYLTFGGTGYDPKKLLSLSELLIKKGYRVIVSASNIVDPEQFKPLKGLYVGKFLPGFAVCQKVDIVVCHGGIGTISQALVAGKPVVVVPFNPDQYLHGFRFEELGLGKCVSNLKLIDFIRLDWENFQQRAKDLSIDRITEAIEGVLKERQKFNGPIAKYSKMFADQNGHKKAADILERLIKQ
ncbi:MAG: glycosyltransferase [bacterium]|nr:glycosyltransferase [bacterium]